MNSVSNLPNDPAALQAMLLAAMAEMEAKDAVIQDQEAAGHPH